MVQIIDNRADLTGTVQSSEEGGAVLQVMIDEALPVEGFPHLANDAVGQVVVINVPKPDVRDLPTGTRVRCRVRKTSIDRYAALPGRLTVDV